MRHEWSPGTLSAVPDVPAAVRERMIAAHGAEAEEWLRALPAMLARLQAEWGFDFGAALPGLSYAYVAQATLADGALVVVKAQPPHLESRSELAALRAWDGRGAVRLLKADTEHGIALLERLTPGETLESVADDDEATRVLARVMRTLHVPPPADAALITLERWGDALFDYSPAPHDPVPADLVRDAASSYRALLESSPPPALLHGDLHHGNVLSSDRGGWLAIDPKGVVGDPAFEPSALFFNPLDRLARESDIPALMARRLAVVSETSGLERGRVAAWGFARTVLSICWSASSGSPIRPHLVVVARTLRGVAAGGT